MNRRDLLTAGLAVGAAGVAAALQPRHRLILLQKGTVAETVPVNFGSWSAEASSGLVTPDQAGKLARTLYSEIVSRVYSNAETGAEVMLLAAYGDTQSDLLQLHRPEACYPAVGFKIASTVLANLPVANGLSVPGRKVVAVAEDRRENISYWTRIGELLPQSGPEQRRARLQNALHGYIADGILFRCSVLGESGVAFGVLDRFIPELLHAVAGDRRPVLVGSQLARRMA
jgi:EpsI family protein